jgi:hypothetical protein
MVLPPHDALVHSSALDATSADETYAARRARMVKHASSTDGDAAHATLGCGAAPSKTGSAADASLAAYHKRLLQWGSAATCPTAGDIYCWHRCMAPAAYNATVSECAGLQTQCMNPRGQVQHVTWLGWTWLGLA